MRPAAAFVHPSNLVSYASLACALASVDRAAAGDLHGMAALWAGSALADNFDGAFARRFARDADAEAFGRQLDSLIDAVAFGAAPVVGLRLCGCDGPAFWAAALAFCVANVTRLGHFNLAGGDGYVGLPTTEAALVLATALLVPGATSLATVLLAVLAVAMLAPVPVPAPRGVVLAGLVAWLVAVPLAHLWLAR